MTKIHFGPDDNLPVPFGRYRGKTSNEIAKINPSYVVWLYEGTDCGIVTKELYEACVWDVREDESEPDAEDEDRLQSVDQFMQDVNNRR